VWDASAEALGIGTNTPSSLYTGATNLVVGGGTAESGMTIYSDSTTGNLYFADGTTGAEPYAGYIEYNHASDYFRLGTAGAEAMRIDSSGNLLVGTTVSGGVGATIYNPAGVGRIDLNKSFSGAATAMGFYYNGGQVGSITYTDTSTSFNTSSDQRLKENIADAPSASDDIDAIQVRSFDWKADGQHQKYGMIAQELQTVAPEAVSGNADSEEMMGVDYSKLVPMMLKEIQSLRARVAQLES
jgi:hypothetical protein